MVMDMTLNTTTHSATARQTMSDDKALDLGEDKSLLLVDDDEPFLRRLAKAMEKAAK